MGSTFGGLEIAKRGLFAQQSALYTTGHNISNANTEGYTRQTVNMQATAAFPYPSAVNDVSPGQVGTGVMVQSIDRMREQFLDLQFRGENKTLGEYSQKTDTLSKVETIMNEPSDTGLQKVLDNFWQAWQDLSANPNDDPARTTLLERAKAVTDTFGYVNNELAQLQTDVNNNINAKIDSVNSYSKQIADLNNQIKDLVPLGYAPNDLYDQRDLLVDKLSKMANIDVEPSTDGMVNVYIVNGDSDHTKVSLVNGTNNYDLVPDPSDGNQLQGTVVDPDTSSTSPVNMSFSSGELAGLFESRDNIIPSYMSGMDNLAADMASKVNTAHNQGVDLNGDNGEDFFVVSDESNPIISAGNIQVNPDITNAKIAASSSAAASSTTSVGDGKNATNIADQLTTINGSYKDMIAQLGIQSQEAQRLQGNSQTLVTQVDNQRQSISGVSIDEEMTNMIKYQKAYNAAARTITTMDQMLDKVINDMGMVGR